MERIMFRRSSSCGLLALGAALRFGDLLRGFFSAEVSPFAARLVAGFRFFRPAMFAPGLGLP